MSPTWLKYYVDDIELRFLKSGSYLCKIEGHRLCVFRERATPGKTEWRVCYVDTGKLVALEATQREAVKAAKLMLQTCSENSNFVKRLRSMKQSVLDAVERREPKVATPTMSRPDAPWHEN